MSRFLHKSVVASLFAIVNFTAVSASALTESPRGDSLFYYQIGGGRHVTLPPSLTITTIDLSVGASMSNLNCGLFDPLVAIESSLDDLKDGVDQAINTVEIAAGAAIANLPGYILQKANPGLYDLFQNALLRAQESFSLATKSCERMQYEVANNINPYAEWITLSRGDSWRRSIGIGGVNIHAAADAADNAHNEGFEWIGGIRRGGNGQRPVRVLSEVAAAGMNMLSNRSPETTGDLPASVALRQHFTGPNAVGDWVTQVLGELEIGICDSCDQGSQPGKGLIPYIEDNTEIIIDDLIDLVAENPRPDRTNLENVSAPGIAVTLQVIKAIQNLSPEERDLYIPKLAHELAEARVVEEAGVVRRLLLAGVREGYVSGVDMAVEEVQRALDELDTEINTVIFEKNKRVKKLSGTIIEVLLKDQATRQSSVNTPASIPEDDRPLRRGGVAP